MGFLSSPTHVWSSPRSFPTFLAVPPHTSFLGGGHPALSIWVPSPKPSLTRSDPHNFERWGKNVYNLQGSCTFHKKIEKQQTRCRKQWPVQRDQKMETAPKAMKNTLSSDLETCNASCRARAPIQNPAVLGGDVPDRDLFVFQMSIGSIFRATFSLVLPAQEKSYRDVTLSVLKKSVLQMCTELKGIYKKPTILGRGGGGRGAQIDQHFMVWEGEGGLGGGGFKSYRNQNLQGLYWKSNTL